MVNSIELSYKGLDALPGWLVIVLAILVFGYLAFVIAKKNRRG